MKYIIKEEKTNNLGMKLLTIYHTTNKIYEKTNKRYWNATEENPINIVESRKDDYIVSDLSLDEPKEIIEIEDKRR